MTLILLAHLEFTAVYGLNQSLINLLPTGAPFVYPSCIHACAIGWQGFAEHITDVPNTVIAMIDLNSRFFI